MDKPLFKVGDFVEAIETWVSDDKTYCRAKGQQGRVKSDPVTHEKTYIYMVSWRWVGPCVACEYQLKKIKSYSRIF